MKVFKLAFATIITHRLWFLAFFLLIFVPSLLPYITPWEQDPTIVEPARAQTVWVMLWAISLLWMLYVAADFGSSFARQGLGSYFTSMGISKFKQLFQIFLSCWLFLLAMLIITVMVTLFGASPADLVEKKHWNTLVFQYAALFLSVATPLILLSIALASRFGITIGYLSTLALGLYGLYGVDFIGSMTRLEGNLLFEWLYIASPQFRLADLTERLIFKSGPLQSDHFSMLFRYLLLVALAIASVSFLIHTPRAKNA